MPEFAYTARDSSGNTVAGVISAADKRGVLVALAEKSLCALQVSDKTPSSFQWRRGGKVKTRILSSTLAQLADLLQNGVPLLGALDLLTEQSTSPALQDVLQDIRKNVSEGIGLDEAFARHPQVFGDLAVSMVHAGMEGAFLEDALRRTADFLELQDELKGRLASAMTYPAFLATVGTLVTIGLVVFLVPKFSTLFARLARSEQGLPTATIILLSTSEALKAYGIFILGAIAGVVYGIRRLLATSRGKVFQDRMKLKLPLLGQIFLGYAVSRFCRVLGTLLQNGVPLLRSLEISSGSAGNVVLSTAIRKSAENVSAGDTLARPLASCGLIPPAIMAMISIAEQSNNLDNVLIYVADTIDKQNSRLIDTMVRLVEPMMLLVMGGMVMFIIAALLMPVFDMSSALGK
jgi:general secretion pathway protein F/type IV pilus assembly protein PilC